MTTPVWGPVPGTAIAPVVNSVAVMPTQVTPIDITQVIVPVVMSTVSMRIGLPAMPATLVVSLGGRRKAQQAGNCPGNNEMSRFHGRTSCHVFATLIYRVDAECPLNVASLVMSGLQPVQLRFRRAGLSWPRA